MFANFLKVFKNFHHWMIPCGFIFLFLFLSLEFSFLETNNFERGKDAFFAVTLDEVSSQTVPSKEDDYWFSKANCNPSNEVSWDGISWSLKLKNLSKSGTKCELFFSKTITIHLNGNQGTFSKEETSTVSILKNGYQSQLDNIVKPSLSRYIFLKYNTKADGSGIDLSYDSLLNGEKNYFAIWKKNYATISFESPNLLPTYMNSS